MLIEDTDEDVILRTYFDGAFPDGCYIAFYQKTQ